MTKTNDSSSNPSPNPSSGIEASSTEASQITSSSNEAMRPAHRPTRTSQWQSFQSKYIWFTAIFVILVTLAGGGWNAYRSLSQGSPTDQEEQPPTRLPVGVSRAEIGLAQEWIFDEGIVGSVRRRVLNFEVNGEVKFITKVDGRDLREGDTVSQGQLLATIDDRTEIVAIDTAEADLEVAIQEREQAEAQLLQTRADFDKAQSDLRLEETELVRYESLFEDGAVAAIDRDVELNDAEQARAALRVAEQEIEVARDAVQAAEASVEAARARLREATVDWEDTQLVSPIDGIVAYINIREGEYWDDQRISSSGNDLDEVAETAPIVVVEPQSFEVEIELQADEADEIRPGQRAYVVLEENVSTAEAAGATNRNLLDIAKEEGNQGEVFSVSPTLTPGGRGIEINIRNFQSLRNLKVGGRVYVWIEAAVNPNAVMLPLGAIVPVEQELYAFVVNQSSGRVERRAVERGIEGLTGVEIISGIEPGDLVVTDGVNRVVDGTLVEIVSQENGL